MMEYDLKNEAIFPPPAEVYGKEDGTAFVWDTLVTAADSEVYSPNASAETMSKILLNPFALKNMYNYNWNVEANRKTKQLTGVRNYVKCGKTQDQMWMSYRYFRENEDVTQNYEYIERTYGLYKFQPANGHKSNVYSVRVNNSGLTDDQREPAATRTAKAQLRGIIEGVIKEAVKKIAPVSTHLWMVDWQGQTLVTQASSSSSSSSSSSFSSSSSSSSRSSSSSSSFSSSSWSSSSFSSSSSSFSSSSSSSTTSSSSSSSSSSLASDTVLYLGLPVTNQGVNVTHD